MGVVVHQSIRNVIITCIGFGIGAVNTLFLFTKFMEADHYGLVMYLLSTANILWSFIVFGAHNTLIKFYTGYQETQQRNRFLSMLLIVPLCIAAVIGTLGIVLYEQLVAYFTVENPIIEPYIWTIYVLAIGMTYFELLFAWAKVRLQSVFGNLLKEVFVRASVFLLLCLVYLQWLSAEQFIYAMVFVYLLRVVIMGIYAMRLHQFQWEWKWPTNYGTVLKYSFLILIAGSVASLLLDLDKNMIARYMPIANVAVYSLCGFIASVIAVPARAMHQITYPLTAKLINNAAFSELATLYKKSSLNLLIVSGGLLLLILCNVQQLYLLIPEPYALWIWIVVLLGIAKLYDNILGIANAILYNSDHYRLVLYIGVGMAVLSFVLNWWCIPRYGIEGAAIATFIAISCYNSTKLVIIWRLYRMHPFSVRTLWILLLIALYTISFYYWEFSWHPILNIALKSSLIALSYAIGIYFLKLSQDVNRIIDTVLSKIGVPTDKNSN